MPCKFHSCSMWEEQRETLTAKVLVYSIATSKRGKNTTQSAGLWNTVQYACSCLRPTAHWQGSGSESICPVPSLPQHRRAEQKAALCWEQNAAIPCQARALPPAPAQSARTHRLHQDVVFAVEKVSPGILVQGLHVLPCRRSKAIFRRAAAGVALPDLHTQPGQVRQGTAQQLGLCRAQLLCSQGGLQRNHLHSQLSPDHGTSEFLVNYPVRS